MDTQYPVLAAGDDPTDIVDDLGLAAGSYTVENGGTHPIFLHKADAAVADPSVLVPNIFLAPRGHPGFYRQIRVDAGEAYYAVSPRGSLLVVNEAA